MRELGIICIGGDGVIVVRGSVSVSEDQDTRTWLSVISVIEDQN